MNHSLELGPQHQLFQQLEQACQQALLQVGGATESVFPRAEALLLSSQEFQRGLEFIGTKQKMKSYQSMMDFVFCEATGRYKAQCRAFYAGKGAPLRDILTPEQIAFYDPWLVAACATSAWLHREQKRWVGWPNMRQLIRAKAKVSVADCRILINFTAQ